ncbi:5-methylcytosine restriction system specificity protein McrC [Lacrimispora celerecrescens]|uniref:5-methylcytosine restriction system specificity protein McrC n=1 Tax=Lacrimispora celerecrescens TaxID=29354 RepID=UPI001648FC35|nr:hypothetical protein [Lacrimispora celerecrescens]
MKVQVVEYADGISIDSIAHNNDEINEIYYGINRANKKIANSLRIKRDTLKFSGGKIRALGIAGIIRLTNNVELEVVPKFLKHSMNDDWKATLYLLSTLSKYGSILSTEHIKSSASYISSLYDIAGRILAQEYLKCRNKPIRQYRKEKYRDYSIDGEIDFGTVFERHSDGIEQSIIRFDRMNAYNATIREAMKIVRPYTTDLQTKNILSSAICELGQRGFPSRERLNVPARNREWLQSYDLAFDIIRGSGGSFDAGKLIAPGFIVDTWKLWEWLITFGMGAAGTSHKAISQKQIKWGVKECNGHRYNVNVFPDIEISSIGNTPLPLYLVDAKYKTIKNEDTGEIERDDLYEAFAFCNANHTSEIVLIYPDDNAQSLNPGLVRACSKYYIKDIIIHVVQVSFGSITERGGLFTFSKNMIKGIKDILKNI